MNEGPRIHRPEEPKQNAGMKAALTVWKSIVAIAGGIRSIFPKSPDPKPFMRVHSDEPDDRMRA